MSGLSPDTPIPSDIILHQQSRNVEFVFDGAHYTLSFEFLRVHSPSAEVRGHGIGQETLQMGKHDVSILRIEPVGNYAVRPVFSDGHESGLYSWDILHYFCLHQDHLWAAYLEKLAAVGASRYPEECPTAPAKPLPKCGPAKRV